MQSLTLIDLLLVLLGYLFGSISSAIIVCRLMGLPDPRTQGSKNPGATNVLRVGGKRAAAITLVGDFFKGVLPVVIGLQLGVSMPVLCSIGLAAFFGHLYPIFFGFRGGKGVATALGVLVGSAWNVGLATAATWLVMAWLFRISSLSALTAFFLSPFYAWWFVATPIYTATTVVISAILFWRHRSNIQNLLSGREDKLEQPPKAKG